MLRRTGDLQAARTGLTQMGPAIRSNRRFIVVTLAILALSARIADVSAMFRRGRPRLSRARLGSPYDRATCWRPSRCSRHAASGASCSATWSCEKAPCPGRAQSFPCLLISAAARALRHAALADPLIRRGHPGDCAARGRTACPCHDLRPHGSAFGAAPGALRAWQGRGSGRRMQMA